MKDNRIFERLWRAARSNPNDLRALGLSVDVHNDYRQDGKQFTYWQMSFVASDDGRRKVRQALIGEGETDEEALNKIRAQYAEIVDKLHHAPMCPANHYHGRRAPTGPCSCGAVELASKDTRKEGEQA
jgi:hypothetical protein